MNIISNCKIDNFYPDLSNSKHAIMEQEAIDNDKVLDRLVKKSALLKVTNRHTRSWLKERNQDKPDIIIEYVEAANNSVIFGVEYDDD